MADKSFGVKQVNLINASGTPRIESPNNLNINAVNVAISTDISVGGQLSLGTGTSISSPETNVLALGTNSQEKIRINSGGVVVGTGLSVSVNNGHFNLGYGSTVSHFSEDESPNQIILGVGNTDVVRVRPRSLWINRTSAFGGSRRHDSTPTLIVQGSGYGGSNKEPWIQLITDKFSGDIGANAPLGRIMFSSNGSNGNTSSTASGAWISCESRQAWNSSSQVYPADLIFWTNPGKTSPDKAVGITSEGNVRIYKAGAGIDFSATAENETAGATTTSELLSDYEEGTWTPVDNSAGLTLSTADGRYVKIGRIVHCWGRIGYPSTTNTSVSSIGGLPFANLWSSPVTYSGNISITNFQSTDILPMVENQNIAFRTYSNGPITNNQLSVKFVYVEFRLFV